MFIFCGRWSWEKVYSTLPGPLPFIGINKKMAVRWWIRLGWILIPADSVFSFSPEAFAHGGQKVNQENGRLWFGKRTSEYHIAAWFVPGSRMSAFSGSTASIAWHVDISPGV